jgi:predicted ATPase/DNA-binding SARP family transcriptional activator/Tfp pilus assembly protein PilF
MVKDLRLMLLGGLQIARGDAPLTGFVSAKVQALLCYLAVTGRPHFRPALAGLLWGEMAEASANTNLRKALSNLRKLVGDHLIIDGSAVAFDRDSAYWLDAEAFSAGIEGALEDSREPPLSPGTALSLAEAVALYQGDLLDGFYVRGAPAFEEWVVAERERLRELALRGLHLLVGYHAARGENTQAIDYASRLLALDPWREEAHRQMMRLLARSGQRSAALAQYETCRRVLAEELGVEPMAETTNLYRRIRAAKARLPRLPLQPTPFVGREDELARITRCFDDPGCRLLTLVGPGGIGKTRLALQVAAARSSAFLDGVYFVPLAGIDSPELLAPTIADALLFSFFGRQDPEAQLVGYLREKEVLLVLDSFEHLTAGARLLAEILQHAPQVKLLVTSRARLNLSWEWLFDVRGLPYPADEKAGGIEDYAAVQLFAQFARRVQAGFSLAGEELYVARICRLVEGMPLALELAAAGMRARSCQEIATELARNLDLLATSMQDMPERHRSVRAAFEGSWQLLSSEEQLAFCRLSVFCGGFDRHAAGQVTHATRPLLDALASKSLLREVSRGRYEIHGLLRQFAAGELDKASQERAEVERLHGEYYVAFLLQREGALRGEKQRDTLAEISAEVENVRTAWRWAVAGRHVEAMARAMEGLHRFYDIRGWLQEGKDAFEQAAAALGGARGAGVDGVLGRALARQAWFCFRLGQYAVAQELAGQGLSILRRLDERQEEAFALSVLGATADEQGDYETARARFGESLALYQEAGDRWGMALTINRLGDVARMVGKYEQAEAHYQQCLALYQETGDRAGIASAFNSLGGAAGTRGEYDRARQLFEQSLALRRELDDRFGIAGACHNLGSVAFVLGDYQAAKDLRLETLAICRDIGFRWGVADSLRHLGDACRRLDEYDEAQHYYWQSLVLKRELGHQRGVALTLAGLGRLAECGGDPDQAQELYRQALQVAMEIKSPPVALAILHDWGEFLAGQGKKEQALEVLSFALHHPAAEKQIQTPIAEAVSRLKAQLSPQAVAAIEEKAHSQTLDQVVAQLLG